MQQHLENPTVPGFKVHWSTSAVLPPAIAFMALAGAVIGPPTGYA